MHMCKSEDNSVELIFSDKQILCLYKHLDLLSHLPGPWLSLGLQMSQGWRTSYKLSHIPQHTGN